jgi:CRISPR-associated protein Cas1
MAFLNPVHRVATGRFLHVIHQGSVLAQRGNRLVVFHRESELAQFPVAELQGVLLYGDVRPSSGALRLCSDHGISLTMLTRQGRFRARLASALDHGVRLRLLQYERAKDDAFRLAFAKGIVRGKLLGALAHMERRRNDRGSIPSHHRQVLESSLTSAAKAFSIDSLRGIEGAAAVSYFASFRSWLAVDTQFERRERTSPDAVNALFNLAYTMMLQECHALLQAAGLEPSLGFYHSIDPGRPSLACDWQEEFRHNHADPLVLTLLNRRQIDPKLHFQPPPRGQSGLRLTPAALKNFLSEYERRSHTWRPQLIRQLERLSDCIATGAPYQSCWESGR